MMFRKMLLPPVLLATTSAFSGYTLSSGVQERGTSQRKDILGLRPFSTTALSAKKRKRKQDKSGGPDESTVDEGQPQPVSSLSPALGLAEGASLNGDNIEEEGEVAVFADGSGEDLTSSSSVLEAALAFDIPFPSEASAGYDDSSEDNALFELPDVADLEKKRKSREVTRNAKADRDAKVAKSIDSGTAYDDFEGLYGSGALSSGDQGEVKVATKKRIQRKNLSELSRLLELDPLADYDEGTFVKSYDAVSAVLGESGQSFLGIATPYLQAGHVILLLTSLIGAFVEYPGNPLTEFPTEIRDFLKTSIAIVLAINAVLVAMAVPLAAEKNQPVPLWAVKTFLLGGISFDELNRAPKLKGKQKQRNS